MRPRWRKLWRDAWMERGRALLMIGAIAVSVMGIGTVLGAFAIMTREMPRNYLGTRPAHAALELSGGVDQALVEEVRRRPGIARVEAGEIVLARAKIGAEFRPLLLFVVDDFRHLTLNTFARESGAWPPPDGTMLIERSAVDMLEAREGDHVLVKTPHGSLHEVAVSGLVHDPGLAPAWQEREGYGYITQATLALLGEPTELRELRVTFQGDSLDVASIEAEVDKLASWLGERGHRVEQARVPPPGRHPHQSQMMGVLFLMLTFSVLALILSGMLVATSMAALLARQVREIGVMKAMGARASQLVALYMVFVALLGAAAVGAALPVGIAGAGAFAGMSATMLNLTLATRVIPWWVLAVELAAGILVPLAVAAVPVVRGCRVTVREAMDEYGVGPGIDGTRPRRSWGRRNLALILRNVSRRRTRLVLTLSLLAAGGAMFMTALNISGGWERIVARVYENRHYDVEVRLNAPAAVAHELAELEGVQAVEAWGYSRTAFWRADHVDVVRTYPDGSHGSLAMMGIPADTSLVEFPLLAGHWLTQGDSDGVVLNHMALSQAPPTTHVGGEIMLSLAGRPTRWRVVGVVEEVGAPGIAYVTREAYARATEADVETTSMVRIATKAHSQESREVVIRAIEGRLEQAGASVEVVIPLTVLRTAMGDHVVVLIRMLLAMAALMVVVGMLGLASTMGSNVLERTREIGVLKTIGATPARIALLVMGEALVVGVLSWGVASVLALPLTALVGKSVGMLAFRVRLPVVVDLGALSTWLALVCVVALVATWLPARRASRLTVWEALGRV
ncbi:MAG: ABC transporter permease [Myxococcales bacterium]